MGPRETVILAVAVAGGAFGFHVYRSARTPEQVAARHEVAVDWSAARDDPGKKLTISWMGIPRFASGREGTWIERMLEERFNVEFKPIFLDGMAYQRRKPLMFCGGSVPDVFWDGDPIVVQRNAHHGFVLELPYELLLEHAPNYVRLLNRCAPDAWLYAYWNGKNYGVPTHGIRNIYPTPGLWRKDWLRKFGYDRPPATLDELHDVLTKFVHGDPDGNGVADTVGMGTFMEAWWAAFADVFGAYGVTPYDWMLRDGKMVWGGVLPETRDALALLAGWYQEGLIDPEFASRRVAGQFGSAFGRGKSGYQASAAHFENMDAQRKNSLVSTTRKLNPEAEFAVDKFFIGPAGSRHQRVWGPGAHVLCFARRLAREPEKVLRVLHMLEAMTVDENLWLEARIGQRGVHWDFTEERGVYLLPPYDNRNADRKNLLNMAFHRGTGFFCACGASPETIDKYTARDELAYRREYQNPEWALFDLLGKPDSVPSAGEFLGDLRQLQSTAFTEIVRGDRPVTHFETFVRQWLDQGGAVLTREANEMYRAKKAIFKRVGAVPLEVTGLGRLRAGGGG